MDRTCYLLGDTEYWPVPHVRGSLVSNLFYDDRHTLILKQLPRGRV
jgi:hypothetical protein